MELSNEIGFNKDDIYTYSEYLRNLNLGHTQCNSNYKQENAIKRNDKIHI